MKHTIWAPAAIQAGGAYFQSTVSSSTADGEGFVARFNGSKQLTWCTFFGGDGQDQITGMAKTSGGDIYIAGGTETATQGPNQQAANTAQQFPAYHTGTAYTQTYGGNKDMFIARFEHGTAKLLWSTYYGGAGNEWVNGTIGKPDIATDAKGQAYLTGMNQLSGTSTGNAPTLAKSGYFNRQNNASSGQAATPTSVAYDGLIVQFNSSNERLWATHYGGDNQGNASNEAIFAVATLGAGTATSPVYVYVTGTTACPKTPEANLGNGCYWDDLWASPSVDAFIARFDEDALSLGVETLVGRSTAGALGMAPNPTTGLLTVSLTAAGAREAGLLTVVNALGQLVHSQRVMVAPGANAYSVDAAFLPAGIYHVAVVTPSQMASGKLIKN